MRRFFAVVVLTAAVGLMGCNGKSTPGGPGVGKTDTNKPHIGQSKETFSLSTPTLSTTVKQGESKDADISIKRGTNFDEDVALKFGDLPKGVTISPASPTIKHDDKDAKITIQAADNAAVGDFTVKVTGHPSHGEDATSEFKLKIDKK